jgi:hypothetical protein
MVVCVHLAGSAARQKAAETGQKAAGAQTAAANSLSGITIEAGRQANRHVLYSD